MPYLKKIVLMDDIFGVLSVLWISVSVVRGGVCPSSVQVVKPCVDGSIAGSRIFMDTSEMTSDDTSCVCRLSTNVDSLDINMYFAPGYAGCGSEIQFSSVFPVTFRCDVAGTRLDTFSRKTLDVITRQTTSSADVRYCVIIQATTTATGSAGNVSMTCESQTTTTPEASTADSTTIATTTSTESTTLSAMTISSASTDDETFSTTTIPTGSSKATSSVAVSTPSAITSILATTTPPETTASSSSSPLSKISTSTNPVTVTSPPTTTKSLTSIVSSTAAAQSGSSTTVMLSVPTLPTTNPSSTTTNNVLIESTTPPNVPTSSFSETVTSNVTGQTTDGNAATSTITELTSTSSMQTAKTDVTPTTTENTITSQQSQTSSNSISVSIGTTKSTSGRPLITGFMTPIENTTNVTPSPTKSGLDDKIIAVIVIGVIIFVALMIFLIGAICYKNRQRRKGSYPREKTTYLNMAMERDSEKGSDRKTMEGTDLSDDTPQIVPYNNGKEL
ncbi:hypothetical protein SNE40_019653 [Patella caerulea]|uniref:Uncharacterized protein n=1 Tax=Patella caerulea TaxID=87958 RepID=A0AAN8J6U1_PATCE